MDGDEVTRLRPHCHWVAESGAFKPGSWHTQGSAYHGIGRRSQEHPAPELAGHQAHTAHDQVCREVPGPGGWRHPGGLALCSVSGFCHSRLSQLCGENPAAPLIGPSHWSYFMCHLLQVAHTLPLPGTHIEFKERGETSLPPPSKSSESLSPS